MINKHVIIVLILLNTAARVLLSNMSNTSILVPGSLSPSPAPGFNFMLGRRTCYDALTVCPLGIPTNFVDGLPVGITTPFCRKCPMAPESKIPELFMSRTSRPNNVDDSEDFVCSPSSTLFAKAGMIVSAWTIGRKGLYSWAIHVATLSWILVSAPWYLVSSPVALSIVEIEYAALMKSIAAFVLGSWLCTPSEDGLRLSSMANPKKAHLTVSHLPC